MVFDFGVMSELGLAFGLELCRVAFRSSKGVPEFCRSRRLGAAFFRDFLTTGHGVGVRAEDGKAGFDCALTDGKSELCVAFGLGFDCCFLEDLPDDSSGAI